MRIRKLRRELKHYLKHYGNVDVVVDLSWDSLRGGYYTRPANPGLDDRDGRIHL